MQLGASYESGPLPAGTRLTVSAVGSRISFQEDGVERIGVTDGTLTGGAPGVMTFGAARADNWAGGVPSLFSVGGSVSGLSGGSVVLQDNGGDDLSVGGGDGAFTFGSRVADGAPYSVSVKSQPVGQTCAVSDGSGTVSGADVTGVVVSCCGVGAAAGAGCG